MLLYFLLLLFVKHFIYAAPFTDRYHKVLLHCVEVIKDACLPLKCFLKQMKKGFELLGYQGT